MCLHNHYDPVLIETRDGKFGWFFLGKITGLMDRATAERRYPRGVQVADMRLNRGCLYCAHATYREAVMEPVREEYFHAYFGRES